MLTNTFKKFKSKISFFGTISIFGAFFILISVFAFNSSFNLNDSAHATTAVTSTEVEMRVSSVINITAPSVANLNCEAGATSSAAELCATTSNISVSTNNLAGYTLQMNATADYPNDLTNPSITPAATIPTLSGAYSSANFPTNYWGYTGGTDQSSVTGGYDCSTNYCPILAYESTASNYAPNRTIRYVNSPETASVTAITFAAKLDVSKPSGTYTTSVTYTAVANTISDPISNGMDMQNIDSSICSVTPPYSESHLIYTVRDARDNTNYTVAKLADGNCWMTQNLELGEYGTPMELTSATSNVSPRYGYTLELPHENNSIYKGNSNHYGNYYDWVTATAGSGTTTAGENAQFDICPSGGWRLPYAGSAPTSADNEFYTLLNQNYITTGTWVEATESFPAHWEGVNTSQFTDTPIFFAFSGYINSSGTPYYQSSVGRWWSATSLGPSYALDLYASTDGYVNPRDTGYQSLGSSIRCMMPSS